MPAAPGELPFLPGAVAADPRTGIAQLYRWYAEVEAAGRSRLFADVCSAVAGDAWCLGFLAEMPPAKWQPNLLIAAVRYLYGTPPDAGSFLELVRRHPEPVAALIAARSTQTNEPGRCATLLPALARLRPPLALLEVGASAGLCLLPDRYGYDFSGTRIGPAAETGAPAPVFPCRLDARTPVPAANLDVVWRAGLDLHPVDIADEAERRWLEALVWPGQEERLQRLRQACEVARADPPRIVRGDLRGDGLRALAAEAPPEATLVIFHTAVLAYLPEARDRAAFAATVAEVADAWIANERPACIPGISDSVARTAPSDDAFLLTVDGAPVAWTDPHGAALTWR